MKNSIIFALILYALPLCSIAQQYAVELIPAELKSRATAVVREENIIIRMNKEGSFTEEVNYSITILNSAGENHAHLTLFYNKGKKIGKINGVVYDEFGQVVRKFGSKDFSDRSAIAQATLYDDIRFKYYNPNVPRYPYTISYSYDAKHEQDMYIPFWQPNRHADVAVQHSSYQVVTTSDRVLRIKEENTPSPNTIESDDKQQTYRWTATNIAARKREPLAPSQHPEEITVKVAPQSFRFFKKRGEINDWHDLGKWVYQELLSDKQDLSDATKAKVQEILAPYTTEREKVAALYAYMQQKTRYISIQVGIGGVEPFPASTVDRLGYGDCKALVNYMQALLSEANIESHYCIVEASNTKIDLDHDFASIVDGNHIILCVPLGQDSVWLECTNNKQAFGHLGAFTDDRWVLACTPNGGKLLRTPRLTHEDNLQQRTAKFSVATDGTLKGTMHTLFSGAQLENHVDLVSATGNDLDRKLKAAYNVNDIHFDAVQYHTDFASTEPSLTEELTLHIRNFILTNPQHLQLQPNIFNQANSIPDSKNRINAVYINRGYTDLDEIEFVFEQPLQQIAPTSHVLSCPMGRYELQLQVDGDKVRFSRKLEIHAGTYAAKDYEAYFEFMKNITALDRGKYQLPLDK